MAEYVEGIGDEIVLFFSIFAIIIGVYLAWLSTGIPPIDYYVWLVQMQVHPNPNRRVVQVLQVNNERISAIENQLSERQIIGRSQRALEDFMDAGNENNYSSISNDSQQTVDTLPSNEEIRSDNQSQENIGQEIEINSQVDFSSSIHLRTSAVDQPVQRSRDLIAVREAGAASLTVSVDHENCLAEFHQSSENDISEKKPQQLLYSNDQKLSSVKIKFLDDSQIIASTALESTVGQFKRSYFYEPILDGKIVRLIFCGQLLRDDSRSLLSYGLYDQCVVHCHISSTPYSQPSTSSLTITEQTALSTSTTGLQSDSTSNVRVPQVHRGRPIEDDPNDPITLRIRNAFWRWSRIAHNTILGPNRFIQEELIPPFDAAADAAARGWIQPQNAIGARIGQHLYLIFCVKFAALWALVFVYPQYADRFSLLLLTFLSLFFVTVLFSNRRTENRNHVALTT